MQQATYLASLEPYLAKHVYVYVSSRNYNRREGELRTVICILLYKGVVDHSIRMLVSS